MLVHALPPEFRTGLRSAAIALSGFGGALALSAAVTPVLGQGLGNPAALNEKAPASYKARFDTSKGPIVIEVRRDWGPTAPIDFTTW